MSTKLTSEGRLYSHLLKRVLKSCIGQQQNRNSSVVSSRLIYEEYGDPVKVIKKQQKTLPDPEPNQVLVRMLAAPVNPADINTIQGVYPEKFGLPAAAGNEGVGEVVAVGRDVKDFAAGDRVIPLLSGLGTWSTHLLEPGQKFFKVPQKLGLVEAATLTVNPCTAFRMLRDYVDLKPGDTVIQNGANSACGQNVIQICRVWGLRSVNVVRNRDGIADLKKLLTDLGATEVLTEEEIRKTDLFKSGKLAKPRLALNCVGGQSALDITRHLQEGSTVVTYGGMSREPIPVPTSALIFKDVRFRGYWMTRWAKKNTNNVDRIEMFEELISMMTSGEMHAPRSHLIKFDNYKEALENTMNIKGKVGKKFVLDFS